MGEFLRLFYAEGNGRGFGGRSGRLGPTTEGLDLAVDRRGIWEAGPGKGERDRVQDGAAAASQGQGRETSPDQARPRAETPSLAL